MPSNQPRKVTFPSTPNRFPVRKTRVVHVRISQGTNVKGQAGPSGVCSAKGGSLASSVPTCFSPMNYCTSGIETFYGSISERQGKCRRGLSLAKAGLTFICDVGDPMNSQI